MGECFILIKISAGAYLTYLGARLLFAKPAQPDTTEPAPSTGKTYLSGLFITLANPKVILFY